MAADAKLDMTSATSQVCQTAQNRTLCSSWVLGGPLNSTAKSYSSEPVRYPALQVIDLAAEGAAITDSYRNIVINRVNGSCLRLSVMREGYRWHYHPKSDELFLVVDGCLEIDLADGRILRLTAWQCATLPAGMVHRTRPVGGRSVNLCFEELAAETVFVDSAEAPSEKE